MLVTVFRKLRNRKLGPYKLRDIASTIERNIEASSELKNVDLSPEKFAKLAGISGNTAREWGENDYIELNKELKPPFNISCIPIDKPSKILKVTGCCYGPLGIVAWPISDRAIVRVFDTGQRIRHCIDEGIARRKIWRAARVKRLMTN